MFGLPNAQKLAMMLAKEQIDSEDFIKEHAGSMTADQLYDAVLKATGSKGQAEASMLARLRAQLKSGQPAEA